MRDLAGPPHVRQLDIIRERAVAARARHAPDVVLAGAALGRARLADKVLIVPDLDLHVVARDPVLVELGVHADAGLGRGGQAGGGGEGEGDELHCFLELVVWLGDGVFWWKDIGAVVLSCLFECLGA